MLSYPFAVPKKLLLRVSPLAYVARSAARDTRLGVVHPVGAIQAIQAVIMEWRVARLTTIMAGSTHDFIKFCVRKRVSFAVCQVGAAATLAGVVAEAVREVAVGSQCL